MNLKKIVSPLLLTFGALCLLSSLAFGDETLMFPKCRVDQIHPRLQICLAQLDGTPVVVTGTLRNGLIWDILSPATSSNSAQVNNRLLFTRQIVDGVIEGRPSNAAGVFADATFVEVGGHITRIAITSPDFGKFLATGF